MALSFSSSYTEQDMQEPMKVSFANETMSNHALRMDSRFEASSSMGPVKVAVSRCGDADLDFSTSSIVEGAKTTKEADSQRLESLVNQQAALALEVENARLAYQAACLRLQTHDALKASGVSVGSPMQDVFGFMGSSRADAAMQGIAKEAGKSASKNCKKKQQQQKQQQSQRCSIDSGSSSGTESTGTGPTSSRSSQVEDELENSQTNLCPKTTVMMRNIPNSYRRGHLVEMLDAHGWKGQYDLVYVPIDYKQKAGLGYAFINLVNHSAAESFRCFFQGFTSWNVQSEKVCQVSWSDALQGLSAHIEKYRNAFVMHESVDDEFRPAIYKEGERFPFPEPTKKIRMPKPWSRRH